MDCVFCKIVSGEIPSKVIYQDDDIMAFEDLSPQAPVHFLVIPKKHIQSANQIDETNMELIGKIYKKIAELAKEKGFAESGYRVINNCGEDGGQTVPHIHFHVLAGRSLQWPPG